MSLPHALLEAIKQWYSYGVLLHLDDNGGVIPRSVQKYVAYVRRYKVHLVPKHLPSSVVYQQVVTCISLLLYYIHMYICSPAYVALHMWPCMVALHM